MSNTQSTGSRRSPKPAGEATLDDAVPPPAGEPSPRTVPDRTERRSASARRRSRRQRGEPGEPALVAVDGAPPSRSTEAAVPLRSGRPAAAGRPPREVRQFIAMLRRERKARVRARRLKRLGWAVAAAAAAGYLAARLEQPRCPGAVSPGPPLALARRRGAAAPRGAARCPSPGGPPRRTICRAGRRGGRARPRMTAQCEESFAQQRWRTAVESCTRVFEQAPGARAGAADRPRPLRARAVDPGRLLGAHGAGPGDQGRRRLRARSATPSGRPGHTQERRRRLPPLPASPRPGAGTPSACAPPSASCSRRPAYRQPSARRSTERTL